MCFILLLFASSVSSSMLLLAVSWPGLSQSWPCWHRCVSTSSSCASSSFSSPPACPPRCCCWLFPGLVSLSLGHVGIVVCPRVLHVLHPPSLRLQRVLLDVAAGSGSVVRVLQQVDNVVDSLLDHLVQLLLHLPHYLRVDEHVGEPVGQPEKRVKAVVHRLQMHQVEDGLRWSEGPAQLTAQPVEVHHLTLAVLSRHLKEHGADQRHLPVDWRTAEGVLGLQW